jgi:hypothetical protein
MADSREDLLRQAILAAKEGNPSKALELLLAHPLPDTSPDAALYHFTAGAVLLERGQTGRALAHLEKSRALGGSSPQLQAALTRAQAASTGEAAYPWERWADSPWFVPAEMVVLLVALVTSVALWRRRARLFWGLSCWAAACGVVALHAWSNTHAPARAVEACAVRSGPAEDFIRTHELQPGAEVRLLGEPHARSPGWRRVRVTRKQSGWIEERCLLPLRSGSHTPKPRTPSE